jgi:hypothetical protein
MSTMLLRHHGAANRGRGLNSARPKTRQVPHRKLLETLHRSSTTKRFVWVVLAVVFVYVFLVIPHSPITPLGPSRPIQKNTESTDIPTSQVEDVTTAARPRVVPKDSISVRQQDIHFTGLVLKETGDLTVRPDYEKADKHAIEGENILDTSGWVQHSLTKPSKGSFRVMGAYGIDGDTARPIESAVTSSLLVVVVGSGHLMRNPEKITATVKKPLRELPQGLSCSFSTPSGVTWSEPAVVHVNGTEYAKSVNRCVRVCVSACPALPHPALPFPDSNKTVGDV